MKVLLASVLIVTLASCREAAQTQGFPLQRPFEADPRTAAEVTSDDIAIFEAVIAAYARKGEVVGIGPPPDTHTPLSDVDVARFSEAAGLRLLAFTQTCAGVRQDTTGWRDWHSDRLNHLIIAPSIAENFERRNHHKVSLARFTPRHLRVISLQSNDTPGDRLNDRHDNRFHEPPVLVLTLPGYSASHDAAILEVSSYTRPYGGGSRIMYLRRAAREWDVVAVRLGCVT